MEHIRKPILLPCVYFALLSGCTGPTQETPNLERKNIAPVTASISASDSLSHYNSDSTFIPFGMMNINDNYLILHQLNPEKLLKLFSLPDLQLVYSWGSRGRGPSEYTYPPMFFNAPGGDTLIISDVINFTQEKYAISDSALAHVSTDQLRYTGQSMPLERVRFISDSTYIADYRSPTSSDNFEYIILRKNQPDSYSAFGEHPIKDWNNVDSKHMYHLKSNTFNQSTGIFAAFYMYANSAKFFKPNGDLLSHIVFDNFQYSSVDRNLVAHDFLRLITHSDHRYIYTVGFYRNSDEVYRESSASEPSIFEVWDWEGNSIFRASFDRLIQYFTVSQKHGRIYGFSLANPDAVYTYQIPSQVSIGGTAAHHP